MKMSIESKPVWNSENRQARLPQLSAGGRPATRLLSQGGSSEGCFMEAHAAHQSASSGDPAVNHPASLEKLMLCSSARAHGFCHGQP